MAKRGRPRKNPPSAREVQIASRVYRGLGPAPVVCPCGCDKLFTPSHAGQRFYSNACRQAAYRQRRRRTARRKQGEAPAPIGPDKLAFHWAQVDRHATAIERHLTAIERLSR